MNYLAHLYLGRGGAQFQAGALAGDFIRGILPPEEQSDFIQGVRHHRAIDDFTDTHPAVRTSRQRLRPFRHFSRVIVDVFYDHFLARTWSDWCSEPPLSEFASLTYGNLLSQIDQMPSEMSMVVRRMAAGDWLTSYSEREAVGQALRGISTRIRRDVRLHDALPFLETESQLFESDFRAFFPQVLEFSSRWREEWHPRSPQQKD